MVGVASPCNGDNTDDSFGEQVGENDSDEREMWIPEDQSRGSELGKRLHGSVSEFLDGLFTDLFGLYRPGGWTEL